MAMSDIPDEILAYQPIETARVVIEGWETRGENACESGIDTRSWQRLMPRSKWARACLFLRAYPNALNRDVIRFAGCSAAIVANQRNILKQAGEIT